jgi:hypothetical protein
MSKLGPNPEHLGVMAKALSEIDRAFTVKVK